MASAKRVIVPKDISAILESAAFPQPVTLVSTVSSEGKANILVVSCLGLACKRPFMLSVGIHPFVYSHALIKATGEMTVNFPTDDLIEAVKICASGSGRDMDKFDAASLTPIPATKVKPPLIKECPLNLEVVVKHSLSLGMHELFIVEVVAVHLSEFDPRSLLSYRLSDGMYRTYGAPLGEAEGEELRDAAQRLSRQSPTP